MIRAKVKAEKESSAFQVEGMQVKRPRRSKVQKRVDRNPLLD